MKRILVAEDDRVSQRLASTILENAGHLCFVSPNGKHAYDALMAENDFDLLVTDIMMPVMDGRQLIQTLRGDTRFKDFPIIIMSAVVGMGDIAGLLKLGASRFLAKPLEREELIENVARCLIESDTPKSQGA